MPPALQAVARYAQRSTNHKENALQQKEALLLCCTMVPPPPQEAFLHSSHDLAIQKMTSLNICYLLSEQMPDY